MILKGKFWILSILLITAFSSCTLKNKYAVLISANAEWKSLKKVFPAEELRQSPWGEYFYKKIGNQDVLFFHEGWGKVSAAGATQYVIDRYDPEILINIGTCGGFKGEAERYETILADKTVIYDIIEAMGDSKEAIADYTTLIDLSWLGNDYPFKVRKTLLVSADRDLRQDELAFLKKEYSAVAGDWETGSMAYVAVKNKKKILILRGITDIVSEHKGEAYGNLNLFEQRTDSVMAKLIGELPRWIDYTVKK
ncbi:MAG TPA: 5'-methylthioadenosine/S-adenosylhomocysteine nucleosidase [Bacteroidales bacterium]|nr:5'-methylthioadenosine/S-adenosylhomocysteine nucleosidase [Bacteroidales bacterium]